MLFHPLFEYSSQTSHKKTWLLSSGGRRGVNWDTPRSIHGLRSLRVFMGLSSSRTALSAGHFHPEGRSCRDELGLRSTLRLDTRDHRVSGSSADSALAGRGLLLKRREQTRRADRSPQSRGSDPGAWPEPRTWSVLPSGAAVGTERTRNRGHTGG